ncbi:hypothetical protein ACFLYA_00715 [Candidatus Dependentiae bacterium]
MIKYRLMKSFFVFIFFNSIVISNNILSNRVLGDANWGTHITPLITAVVNTEGPVLEMGCGDFSTPVLHAICSQKKRFLLSAELDLSWMKLFCDLECDFHNFEHVKNVREWENVGKDLHWGVVLIDHSPAEQRVKAIKRLRSQVDIFVVHDTDASAYYGYGPVLSTFKYRYTYQRYKKTTMLVSDTINVALFFE